MPLPAPGEARKASKNAFFDFTKKSAPAAGEKTNSHGNPLSLPLFTPLETIARGTLADTLNDLNSDSNCHLDSDSILIVAWGSGP